MKLLTTTLLVVAPLVLAAHTAAFSATSVTRPKEALAKLVVENLKADTDKLSPQLQQEKRQEFEKVVDDLWQEFKGFEADKVEGLWTPVLTLPGKKSRKQQSLVGNRVEKAGTTTDNFVGKLQQIQVTVPTPRENGVIEGLLQYNPVPTNYSVSPQGKIVLRRIACDNVKATLKYRFLPKLRIPFFKKKGGYLDFIYLDEDVRVTRGNRGGTFVHMRKEYLEKVLEEY